MSLRPALPIARCVRCQARLVRTQATKHHGPRAARRRQPILKHTRLPSNPTSKQVPTKDDTVHAQQLESAIDSPAARQPVIIPHDPQTTVPANSPAAALLSNSALVVVRQLEMMNVFLGYEQANKYAIMSPDGQTIAYLAEEEANFGRAVSRQVLRTRRPFRCTVLDPSGQVLFRISRPFTFINSKCLITLGEDESNVIGQVIQQWHPWRRRYALYQKRGDQLVQFAQIDAPFLSWEFQAMDEQDKVMASISKNWTGFGREFFTEFVHSQTLLWNCFTMQTNSTSQYVLKFDAVELEALAAAENATSSAPGATKEDKAMTAIHQGLTLDQRAILLASAMTTDVDYFSRHSGMGGHSMIPWMMPMPFPSSGAGSPGEDAPTSTDQPMSPTYGTSADVDTELPRSSTADSYWEGAQDPTYGSARSMNDGQQSPWSETPLDEGPRMNDPWQSGQEDVWQVDDWEPDSDFDDEL